MTENMYGVVVLDVHECWALVRAADVGRLALVVDERPDIFPINFVVDHGTVVFRTAAGTKLAAVSHGEPVAFEVDGYVPEERRAWSVVIKGRGEEIRQIHELFDAGDLPLFPWHAEPKSHIVRIVPEIVTGRRFSVVDRPTPDERPRRRRAADE